MNVHSHKEASLIIISLLVLSTLSILSVRVCTVGAQTPAATLTGIISDRGVDVDENKFYDFLEIGVEVNVTSAGTFRVAIVGLYDESNSNINISNQTSMTVEAGIHFFYINLNGTAIYDSGINPSTVTIIDLFIAESDELIDSKYDIPLSTTYFYAEFEPVPTIVSYRFNDIKREIILGQEGSIHITNIYTIINTGDSLPSIEIGVPEDAYGIVLRDEMGNLEVSPVNETLTVNLRTALYTNKTVMLYLSYHVPWEKYVTQRNGLEYKLHYTFYEQFNRTIGKLTASISLPKGAQFQSSTPLDPNSMEKIDLRDTATFTFSNLTQSSDLNFEINYRYVLFWSSFYPTIWVGVLVVIASAFTFLWKAPKPITTPLIAIPPEDIRRFVYAYEEKTNIKSELESMEERLRKGKIPRRRFKVRKKMLDGRLSTISRDLSSLHDKIRAAGPKYANMMRQIEVAETNLEGAEKDIQRVKARYRRGEVSKGAYGKLIDEYNRRSEEAEATIDGVLLRLREEIR